jgi:hypothetical protein
MVGYHSTYPAQISANGNRSAQLSGGVSLSKAVPSSARLPDLQAKEKKSNKAEQNWDAYDIS